MEHPCHRCGTSVEDGVPFCKHCGAPQIRVSSTSSSPPSAPTPQLESPPAPSWPSGTIPAPTQPLTIRWSQAFPITAFAGLLEAFFSLFGLGMVVGGFLSVALYRRRTIREIISGGMGARLGVVSGALGFVIFALIRVVTIFVFHAGARLKAEMLQALDQAIARNPDPQAQAMLQYFKSPQGFTLLVIFASIATLVSFLLLSTLGGWLGATMLGKKPRQ